MNQMIQAVESMGLSLELYNAFHVLGFASVFAVVVLHGRAMGLKEWKCALTVMIVYPVAYMWTYILFWAETGFRSFGGNNIVRLFIYVPLIAYPVAKWLKMEWRKVCSFLAFAPTLALAVSHIGCIFPGCCRGYPSAFGIYNCVTEDIRFPIQFVEILISGGIVVYLYIRSKRRANIPDGKEYPIMLILYGSSRFICEFFRDNEKILWGCSSLAFHALFMFVVGIVALVIIRRKQQAAKISE